MGRADKDLQGRFVVRDEYGTAAAREPDEPLQLEDVELMAQLEAMESWPMPVDEARLLRMERVHSTTGADAHDQHNLAVHPTEP